MNRDMNRYMNRDMNRDMNRGMILSLIKKDLLAYKAFIIGTSVFVLVLTLFNTFVNTNTQEMLTSGIANLIVVIIGSFAMEQKANGPRVYMASLPVTRKATVLARYLTSLLIIFANLLICLLLFRLIEWRLHPELPSLLSPQIVLYAAMYLLIHLSFYYFFFYRFNLIIVMIIYLMPMMLWTALSTQGDSLSSSIIDSPPLFLSWCLGALALFILSYYTSVAYFQKKDL